MYTCQCRGCPIGRSNGVPFKEAGGCILELSNQYDLIEVSLFIASGAWLISYCVIVTVLSLYHRHSVLCSIECLCLYGHCVRAVSILGSPHPIPLSLA